MQFDLDRVIAKGKLKGLHIDVDCDSAEYTCKPGRGVDYKFDKSQDPGGEGAMDVPQPVTHVKTAINKYNPVDLFGALIHAIELKKDYMQAHGNIQSSMDLEVVGKSLRDISKKYIDAINIEMEA